MLMILKTLKLSKNNMFIIYYILLIITNVSCQIKDEPASPSTDDKNNNPNEVIQDKTDLISSNADNPTENTETNNNGNPNINPNVLQGLIQRMRDAQKKSNGDEVDPKENIPKTNRIEHPQPVPNEENIDNHLSLITLGLSSETTLTEDDERKNANKENTDDKKKKKKRKKNKKQLETADNEAESKLNEADNIENQQPENSINDIQLGLSSELTTTTDVELKKANYQNTDGKKLETDKNIIEDIQTHDNMEINPMNIPVSPLENVNIVKIKQNLTDSEKIRKQKKTIIFEEYKPSDGNIARIHCTFLGDVFKMYKKVKKRFVGHFCHSIVIGTPIILQQHEVLLSSKMKFNLEKVHPVKNESLLIVIMQYSSYSDWAKALVKSNQLVLHIIQTVDRYNIDGILFSNLQPIMGQDQIDNDMTKNLISFFKELKKKKDSLKIGITIHMYSQWITSNTEFTSFDQLNELVTWYSYYTISMVKCSEAYISSGTSPLNGKESFTNALHTIQNTKIDMSKLIVGIQLFPNKNNELEAFTYEEFCSASKKTWNKWCAAQPEDLRLKGLFLRNYAILGVQLFYMHSDDYRSSCGCHTFPLTRALLRGLLAIKEKDQCNFHMAYN